MDEKRLKIKKVMCYIGKCEEPVIKSVDICDGYVISNCNEEFEPFEKPILIKISLCKKHFRQWCEASYRMCFSEIGKHG